MILITICARGDSKGVPNKNIRLIDNIPLINYSISAAQEFSRQLPSHIALSTDSNEIKRVAQDAGLETDYHRPSLLATDSAGKVEVIRDLLEYEEEKRKIQYDYILDLDVTSPLRTVDDLIKAYKHLAESEAYNLFSVSPAQKNPYFNMVELEDGYVKRVKTPEKGIKTRQSAPLVYELNASFYFYRRSFFQHGLNSAITERSIVYVMPNICFDIDEEMDYVFMKYLIENKLVKTI